MSRPRLLSGLSGRLALAVAAATVVTVAAAFLVVYRDTESAVRGQIDSSIRAAAIEMAHAITEQPRSTPRALLLTARHYVAAQPYGSTPALLFLIVPGHGTASNQSELFGQNEDDDGESANEQAQENRQGRELEHPLLGYDQRTAPDIGLLRLYELRLPGDPAAYVGAAEPYAQVDAARHGVASSFLLAGGLALVLAILSAYLIGSRMSRPLRRVALVAAEIDAGDLSPRMRLAPSAAHELQILADAFNHMLDRLEHAFAGQRDFIADASHELRTPLTVIRGQMEMLADGSASAEEITQTERIVQAEIARLSRMVDDMLLLVQVGHADFIHRERIPLQSFVNELWDGLSLTAEREFVVGALPPLTLNADPDRLAQALRNLARNAVAHTQAPDGLVRIDVTQPSPTTVRLVVSDNGPGISPPARVRVFERFYRIDPARTRAAGGAGLGLAIVQGIAEAHGGTVRVGDSDSGGARIEIDLPLR